MDIQAIKMYSRAFSYEHTEQRGHHDATPSTQLPRLVDAVRLTRRTPNVGHAGLNRAFWGLDYHFENAGEYSLDGTAWHRRQQHTAHLYAPGTRYWERCNADDLPFPETYFVFQAKDSGILDALVAKRGFARFTDTSKTLLRLFQSLPTDTPSDEPMSWRAQGILLLVLDCLAEAQHLADTEYAISSEPLETAETLATRVDHFLLTHYHQRVSLADIADALGVSRSTLTHRYNNETGTTPMTRLLTYRLDAARSLMLKGERLKLIAARTGFHDEYHLSKAFKRHFGQSPRLYVRALQ